MIKSLLFTENMSAGSTVSKTSANIGLGKTWIIKSFGACDINLGDNKSTVYILQYGSNGSYETIRVLSLTGITQDICLNKEIIGDGTKNIKVIIQNKSAFTKEYCFWLEVVEKV